MSLPLSSSLPSEDLQTMLQLAIDNARLTPKLVAQLPPPPTNGCTWVLGAGKAAAHMAQVLEQHYPGPLKGLVVTPYGYEQASHTCPGHHLPAAQIEVMQAAHPIPDAASMQAAQQLLRRAHQASAQDQVFMLLSGGGSALLCQPAAGVSLADKQRIHQALLHSGANIRAINCVRRHLSAIKGGHLALACAPAPVHNLIISDVPGDTLIDIASGPTTADPTTSAQALEILQQYAIPVPEAVQQALAAGQLETPKPEDRRLPPITNHWVATAQKSLMAAAHWAQQQGYQPLVLGDAIEGEAREVAKVMAGIARSVHRYQQPLAPPCVILSGGETTVTVGPQAGQGGPNVEFLLALLISLEGLEGVYALAADTDGADGSQQTAGAWIGPDSLQRARQQGLDPQQFLAKHRAHQFFAELGQQVHTGPTYTNVNDFRALLII